MKSISANLNIMIKASEKASKILIRDFGELENLQVTQKGPKDFVTNSDKKVEKILIEELEKYKKNYSFLSEENGKIENKDKENVWIIDPIDGTTNFLHGIPHFSISIGLKSKNEIIAGVIFDPIKNELFFGEKDNGSYEYQITYTDSNRYQENNVSPDRVWGRQNSMKEAKIMVLKMIARYADNTKLKIKDMWANVSHKYSYNRFHTHPGNLWSGVYYVQSPPNCGNIIFTLPERADYSSPTYKRDHTKSEPHQWETLTYEPIEGRAIFFPSWFGHEVEQNLTDVEGQDGYRISISFNSIQIKKEK